jgi:hypothetical protein
VCAFNNSKSDHKCAYYCRAYAFELAHYETRSSVAPSCSVKN